MAGNDGTISSRLQLDGEQEYKKALNDAYRSLRVLRSELKAETAELGKNATQQEKDRKKVESLKKQIAEQEKVVQTLTKALADSREQYKDNQEVQDKWAEKLNKARESLAKMKNELDGTQSGLKNLGNEMKNVSGETGSAVSMVVTMKEGLTSLKDTASGLGSAFAGAFTSSLETLKGFVDEVMALMTQAWAAAGNWKQIQAMFGGDVKDIQAVYSGMALQGVDSSDITGGIQKLIANTHGGNKDTIAALKKLGVEEKKFSNHWDFYTSVMDKLAAKSGKEQDTLSRAIFGEKAGFTQNDVLSNWMDARRKYQTDIKDTGLELTSAQIDALDEVSHKITEVQQLWDRIKMNIGAKLSELLNMDQQSEDVLVLLRDVASIFSGTGDRKELTIKFSEDLEKFVADVQEAMKDLSGFLKELGGDLEQSENPLLKFIGRLMKDMGGFLDWLEQNGATILGWLEKLLPIIIQNKISQAVSGKGLGEWAESIMSGIFNIGIFKTFLNKSKGGGGGAGPSIIATGKDALATLGQTSLGMMLGRVATTLGSIDPAGVLSLIPSWIGDKTVLGNTLKNGGSLGEAVEASASKLAGNASDWWKTATDTLGFNDNWMRFWDNLWNPKRNPAEEEADRQAALGFQFTPEMIAAAQQYWDEYRNGADGGEGLDKLTELIPDENILNALLDKIENFAFINDTIEDLPDSWFTDTKKAIEGLKAPEGWYADIQAALNNLMKDRYTGDKKNEEDRQIVIQVTANNYMDGELVSSQVSRKIYSQLNHRFIG